LERLKVRSHESTVGRPAGADLTGYKVEVTDGGIDKHSADVGDVTPTRTSSSPRPITPSTSRTSSGLPALDAAGDPLRALAGRGWDIVLATWAGGAELSALPGATGPVEVILGAAGAEDTADGKTAPDLIRQARELAGAPGERAVFVGDRVWDIKAAVRGGVTPVAGCRTGSLARTRGPRAPGDVPGSRRPPRTLGHLGLRRPGVTGGDGEQRPRTGVVSWW
jgi:hypothetical protein